MSVLLANQFAQRLADNNIVPDWYHEPYEGGPAQWGFSSNIFVNIEDDQFVLYLDGPDLNSAYATEFAVEDIEILLYMVKNVMLRY